MEENEHLTYSILGLVFTIQPKEYLKILICVCIGLVVLLFSFIFLFNYEMTNADIPGGTVAGILLAYLIHIIKD